METGLVQRAGFPCVTIRAGGLHGLSPVTMLKNAGKMVIGTVQAWRQVRRFRPDALLLTGGYVGMPVAFAAWLQRIPALVFLPDVEPAISVRAMARFAKRVAVNVPDSQKHFPSGKSVVVGYPLRPELRAVSQQEARQRLGLAANEQTLLVSGGSQGARSINRALTAILEPLLEWCQVVHISGPRDAAEMQSRREELPERMRVRYHLYEYLHEEMGDALSAADLVLSRAGASTLGEYPRFGLPAILVPYPYAWHYQRVNADYLVNTGCARRLDDEHLGTELLSMLREMLGDPELLRVMGQRARTLARPDAAGHIANELLQLADRRQAVSVPTVAATEGGIEQQ